MGILRSKIVVIYFCLFNRLMFDLPAICIYKAIFFHKWPNGVNLKSGWRLFSSADNLTTVRGNEIIPEARIKNNF